VVTVVVDVVAGGVDIVVLVVVTVAVVDVVAVVCIIWVITEDGIVVVKPVEVTDVISDNDVVVCDGVTTGCVLDIKVAVLQPERTTVNMITTAKTVQDFFTTIHPPIHH
jgi:hypothetical protein